MSSQEEKMKKRLRMQRKNKERKNSQDTRREKIPSPIAKDLRTSKYKMRVIKDKRGKEYDLSKMTHKELVEAIYQNDESN